AFGGLAGMHIARLSTPARSKKATLRMNRRNCVIGTWLHPHLTVPCCAGLLNGEILMLAAAGHFPLKLYSNERKPVTLPPGRARLSTRPAATGSDAAGNTIGTVRVSCNNGPTVEMPVATMTSGASATNSAAYLRLSSGSNFVHRVSIRILRPVIHPNCC